MTPPDTDPSRDCSPTGCSKRPGRALDQPSGLEEESRDRSGGGVGRRGDPPSPQATHVQPFGLDGAIAHSRRSVAQDSAGFSLPSCLRFFGPVLLIAAALLFPRAALAQIITIPHPGIPSTNNSFSWMITGIGDVDGDGFGDLLSGNYDEVDPDHPPGEVLRTGSVHVYSGATGVFIRTLRSPIVGTHGLFGWSRTGIEDLDDDGRAEILVGAYFERRAHNFSGASGDHIYTLMAPPEYSGGNFGIGVTSVPDIDGDGFDEYVVGASGEDQERGAAYVFSARAATLRYRLVSPSRQVGGRFGRRVAGIADLDGDGAGDLAIAAAGEETSIPSGGRVHVFSGGTGAFLYTVDSPYGPCGFGHAVTALADFDGDGCGDFAVGADCRPPGMPATYRGIVHIFSGATGTRVRTILSPAAPMPGNFASSVLGTPDLNGDGWPELLVNAPLETPPGFPQYNGRAYLFCARTGELLRTFVSPNPTPQTVLNYGQFSTGIAVIPDCSGDGRPDLAFGSQDCTGVCPPTTYGAIYIFHSCAADYNYDGTRSVQDIWDFLSHWLAFGPGQPPGADFNRDGVTNVPDLFAFLNAWFAGCP